MEKEASQLERDHVHSVYEKIAPYFNDARYKAWPRVRQFISEQEPGSLIADIGEWSYHVANEDLCMSSLSINQYLRQKSLELWPDYKICLLLCSTVHRYMKSIQLFAISSRSTKPKH